MAAMVLVGTLAVAVFQDHIQRHFFYPQLALDFIFGPPDCHKTEFRNTQTMEKLADAYYFRFSLINIGKTPAELCEVVLEKFLPWDEEKRDFRENDRWNPVNLKWAGFDTEFRTINPGRKVFCDIGFVTSKSNPSVDEILRNKFPFKFAVLNAPFNQRYDFDSGKYKIEVAVYCKNLKKGNILTKEFIIDYDDVWHDEEKEMFAKNIKISSK